MFFHNNGKSYREISKIIGCSKSAAFDNCKKFKKNKKREKFVKVGKNKRRIIHCCFEQWKFLGAGRAIAPTLNLIFKKGPKGVRKIVREHQIRAGKWAINRLFKEKSGHDAACNIKFWTTVGH